MGAARKLTQEIDRTLKKVQEGLDSFDEIWNKVYDGDIAHIKDKLEGDLKKEIKKLQRHRDQIKTWVASNDVKDKTDLLEARRKIERQMEKFKECEKEMKTKAFSKEGLGRVQKVDPRERERSERIEWLNSMVDELGNKVEMNESEQEVLLSNLGKKKEPPHRVKELTDINARHKKHVERLEQILRALDNETIQFEQVDDIKDNFDDYLENHENGDSMYEDVDCIYTELLEILDNIEVHVPIVEVKPVAKAAAGPDPKKTKAEKDVERERERMRQEKERERASVQAARAQLHGQTKGTAPYADTALPEDSKAVKAAALLATSAAVERSPMQPTSQHTSKAAQKDALPAAATSGAAVQRLQNQHSGLSQTGQAPGAHPSRAGSDSGSSLSSTLHKVPTPVPFPAGMPPQQANAASASAWGARGELPEDGKPAGTPRAAPEGVFAGTTSLGDAMNSPLPAGFAPFSGTTLGPTMDATPPTGAPAAAADPSLAGASSFANVDLLHACAETGHAQPLLHDGVWDPHVCTRRGPRPFHIPASYPLVPPAILDNPDVWLDLADDDLFTAFYFKPGTNYQLIAARELTKKHWRYHKNLRTWFCRQSETRIVGGVEVADYHYMDPSLHNPDEGWALRKKQDFAARDDQFESQIEDPVISL